METNKVEPEHINNASDENIDKPENQMKNVKHFRIHEGVNCGVCKGQINVYRYKCAVYPDFDLCSKCEMAGLHPHHILVQIKNEQPEMVDLVIQYEESGRGSEIPRPEHENGNIQMMKCRECPD